MGKAGNCCKIAELEGQAGDKGVDMTERVEKVSIDIRLPLATEGAAAVRMPVLVRGKA